MLEIMNYLSESRDAGVDISIGDEEGDEVFAGCEVTLLPGLNSVIFDVKLESEVLVALG